MVSFKKCASGWLRRGQWLCLLGLLAAPPIEAASLEIRALFKPDPANPQKNEFINQTPSTGYCEYYPQICRDIDTFSLRLMTRVNSNKPMQANASQRNSAMFKVPGAWRTLTVNNTETGEASNLQVRISGVGSNYVLSHSAASLTGSSTPSEGHNRLWHGYSWVNPTPPCGTSGIGFFGAETYAFFWKVPDERSCVKTAQFNIPGMTYGYLDFAYELRTPDPLKMSAGNYTGTLKYSMGPGGDFDFGDVMIPDDTDLTLDFNLEVQHTLKVDIPPGGEKVRLVPAGGWQSWLQAGRKPVRLFRDQPFHISASSRFKMHLECDSRGIFECVIHNPASANNYIEVQVSVTLPSGLTDLSGQPVNRRRLHVGQASAQQFQPGFYVDRGAGVLHFEIPEYVLPIILMPGQGGTYVGNVTVIWDSDI
ncbi:hypothetical protein AB1J88_26540 [Pseudomonas sp. S8]|uniref:hypothetical protein n=1 Tax=Pseudomonas sp. S8 TaxID=211136 RepID=UPI003D2E40D1